MSGNTYMYMQTRIYTYIHRRSEDAVTQDELDEGGEGAIRGCPACVRREASVPDGLAAF